MGFGVIVAIVVVLCVVWKCCCKMMNGHATGKVAPVDDDPENPATAAGEDDTEGL